MKNIIFFLCLCYALNVTANPYLIEVNKEWVNQPDIALSKITVNPNSETQAIHMHLQLVEQTLRARSVQHLSAAQQKNRKACLDILHRYWQANVFPQNENYTYRTPIFIDAYNTFCAVGHLMKESGFEKIAREISEQNNLVYVRDIENKKATEWMHWAGLTLEECALIQPTYSNPTEFKKCGGGTNGNVYSMKTINNELIVGGDFTTVDGTIASNSLAKWKKVSGSYVWEDFSIGIPTATIRVKAIGYYDGKYWAGGENINLPHDLVQQNLYYYENGQWHLVTDIRGNINDIIVFQNELYICGTFRNSPNDYSLLAKWNKTTNTWSKYLSSYSGTRANKMLVYNQQLIIGGFFYGNGSQNVIAFDGQNLIPLYLGLANEVFTIEEWQGQLYAAGITNGSHLSYAMKYYNGQHWLDTNSLNLHFTNSINVLKSINGNFMWGGNFTYPGAYTCENLRNHSDIYGWGKMDSTVLCIEEFDGNIYVGGLFLNDDSVPGLNHITYFQYNPLSLEKNEMNNIYKVYPNPTTERIFIELKGNVLQYSILDISGKKNLTGKILNAGVDISSLSNGMYLLELVDQKGNSSVQKIYKE